MTATKLCIGVSILVVMDYIKELGLYELMDYAKDSFNPCCDGLYKRTVEGYYCKADKKKFQSLL